MLHNCREVNGAKTDLPQQLAENRIRNVDASFFRFAIRCRVENTALRPLAMTDGIDDELVQHLSGQLLLPQITVLRIENRADPSPLGNNVVGARRW